MHAITCANGAWITAHSPDAARGKSCKLSTSKSRQEMSPFAGRPTLCTSSLPYHWHTSSRSSRNYACPLGSILLLPFSNRRHVPVWLLRDSLRLRKHFVKKLSDGRVSIATSLLVLSADMEVAFKCEPAHGVST